MSQLLVVQSNHTTIDQSGTPFTGATAPTGLTAPTVTATPGGLQVAWTPPSEVGGTPLLKWTISASDGTDPATTQDNLDPSTGFYQFDNLTAGTSYTVTLTATNSHGTASATATATPLSTTLDPRTYDYAANTGPQATITQTLNTPNTTGRIYTVDGAVSQAHFPTGSYGTGTTDTKYIETNATASLVDCLIEMPVRHNVFGMALTRSKVAPDIGEVVVLAGSGSAVELAGTMTNCEIAGPGDGVWPGGSPGNPAIIDTSWIHPAIRGAYTFQTKMYGGSIPVTSTSSAVQPGASGAIGPWPTPAQCQAAQKFATNGQVVDPLGVSGPQIIYSSATGGAPTGYQVIGSVGGATPVTLGNTSEASGWTTVAWDTLVSGNTSQPFVSGNAILICLAAELHGDTMQWIGSGFTIIKNSKLEAFDNSAGLVQCVSTAKSAAFTAAFTAGSNVVTNVTDFTNIGVGCVLVQVSSTSAILPNNGVLGLRGSLIRSVNVSAGTVTLKDAALANSSSLSVQSIKPMPTRSIEWYNDTIGASGIYWLGITGSNVGDGLYDGSTTDKQFGGLSLWAAGTGPVPGNTSEYWDMNTNACHSRQWSMYLHDCYFGPQVGVLPTSISQVTLCRGAIIVSSIAQWKQCVANQFGLSVTADAATLDEIWNETYDYTQKPNVYGDQGANIVQSVLQQRRAYGMMIGSCDARSFIVAEPNNYGWDGVNTSSSVLLGAGGGGNQTNLLVPGSTTAHQTINRNSFPTAWDSSNCYIGA